MKTHITLMAVTAVVVSTAWISPASSPVHSTETKASITVADPGFSSFRVHRQGKNGVTATWGMTSENGVSGFLVEKTYEDPTDPYAYWETVTAIPSTGARSYKHNDENVYPGYITYRVTATLTDSRSLLSELVTIHINGR